MRPSAKDFLPASGLCFRCYGGDHSKRHGQLGCMVLLARPPFDILCHCVEPGTSYSHETNSVIVSHATRSQLRNSVG